jgi:lysophospholipase L1-like esterase
MTSPDPHGSATAHAERSARRAALIFVGIFAAVAAGVLALLVVGEALGIVTLLAVLSVTIVVAGFGSAVASRITLIVLTVVLIGSVAVVGVGLAQIAAAVFAGSTGATDPADEAALFSAESKIRVTEQDAGFRLELEEAELNAVLQNALADTDSPLRKVTFDITNEIGDPARIAFVGAFKSGDLTVEGVLSALVAAGSIELEIVDIDVGMFTLPGVGRGAVEDMIESVADLETAVAEQGADIQEITIGSDKIIITGVNRTDEMIESSDVLAALGQADALTPESVEVVPRFGPGRVRGTRSLGTPVYLALGDSLAANVGVEDSELGYVSRFHSLLEERDATEYGMINIGVSGETSGTLLNGGQLAEAERIAAERDVAFVTIDIGANDLLGHLGAPTCSADIEEPECRERLEASLAAYERNIGEIFDRLDAAFPDATILFLSAYNPFSFGYGELVAFETESNATLQRLNTIATLAAVERGFLAADGFGPMQGTVGTTTRMRDVEPDIHPTALGYDVLTGALWDAVVAAEE